MDLKTKVLELLRKTEAFFDLQMCISSCGNQIVYYDNADNECEITIQGDKINMNDVLISYDELVMMLTCGEPNLFNEL